MANIFSEHSVEFDMNVENQEEDWQSIIDTKVMETWARGTEKWRTSNKKY